MKTNEINNENVKVLAKLGVDSKDIANIYLQITEEGKDISKVEFIDNLTDTMKFFQSRNNDINDENKEAIYKEDIIEMVKNNNKLLKNGIKENIEPICKKIDSYYFMNPGYTNIFIKRNPNIFNVNSVDLDKFSSVLSEFAIKVDGQIVNLLEYVIKQNGDILNKDVHKVCNKFVELL